MVPPGPARILVVDDDPELRDLLGLVLRRDGHTVRFAADGAEAVEKLAEGTDDLVVLDVRLGDDDGRRLLTEIRAQGELPVILVSGEGETADRVLGLRLGADDFLAKPFSPMELSARVESVLRRAARRDIREPDAPAAGLILDETTRDVRIDGRTVELTAREFDLLAFLVRSPRQVFTRGQILTHVWQSSPEWQDEATVTEHVRRVRHKIESDPDRPRWIVTVRGVGYRYEP